MKKLLLLLSMALVVTANAAEIWLAKVETAGTGGTFNSRKLAPGETISEEGVVQTKDASVTLVLNGMPGAIEVLPRSSLRLWKPMKDSRQSIELLSGSARVKVHPKSFNGKAAPFTVRTKAAVMGVRGTRFLAIANPVLNEAEIVVFEGKVEFVNANDGSDVRLVSPGYWGGVGGRFGAKTHELIRLSGGALTHFETLGTETDAPATTGSGAPPAGAVGN